MDRTEQVRQVVDEILRGQPDEEERRCGFIHLYGVAQACALLALKRGLDAELCTVAGNGLADGRHLVLGKAAQTRQDLARQRRAVPPVVG